MTKAVTWIKAVYLTFSLWLKYDQEESMSDM